MKQLVFIFAVFSLVLVIGCNGALRIQAPELETVIMDETYVIVFWEMNDIIESNSDFAGYNIYVYTDSSALRIDNGEELNKFNSQLIRDTSYQINGLPQDSIYYIQVRTVNIDAKVGGYNITTPFIEASPRPEFDVIMNIADTGQPVTDSCAIRFSDAMIMSDSTMPDSGADMWIRTENDTVWFVSPADHPAYGSGARNTLFANVGPADFDAVPRAPIEPDTYEVRLELGDIVVAKTQDNFYVKILIEAIDLQNSKVTMLYAYQNVVDFPYF